MKTAVIILMMCALSLQRHVKLPKPGLQKFLQNHCTLHSGGALTLGGLVSSLGISATYLLIRKIEKDLEGSENVDDLALMKDLKKEYWSHIQTSILNNPFSLGGCLMLVLILSGGSIWCVHRTQHRFKESRWNKEERVMYRKEPEVVKDQPEEIKDQPEEIKEGCLEEEGGDDNEE